MRRITLAMTLGLGLAIAVSGCGPTADPAAPAVPAGAASDTPAKVKDAISETIDASKTDLDEALKGPAKGGMSKNAGGGGGPGIPADMMKGMQSDSYRNQSGSQGPGGPAKAKSPDAPKPADDKKDTVTLTDKEIKNIQMLPEADQKLALLQKVCLVGDPNHLGEMGVPVKEVVMGKTVFLCCKSCVEDLKKDPDKYLAKLAKLAK